MATAKKIVQYYHVTRLQVESLGSVSSSRPDTWACVRCCAVAVGEVGGSSKGKGLRRDIPRCRNYRKRRLNESRTRSPLRMPFVWPFSDLAIHPTSTRKSYWSCHSHFCHPLRLIPLCPRFLTTHRLPNRCAGPTEFQITLASAFRSSVPVVWCANTPDASSRDGQNYLNHIQASDAGTPTRLYKSRIRILILEHSPLAPPPGFDLRVISRIIILCAKLYESITTPSALSPRGCPWYISVTTLKRQGCILRLPVKGNP